MKSIFPVLVIAGLIWAAVAEEPASPKGLPLATLLEDRPAASDPTVLYALYIPRGIDPDGKHPTLLIFDPRGRARVAAELFQPAADRFGWLLLSSNDSRSGGPMEPNERAMKALWSETRRLTLSDPRRIYATGFSGGGMVAWILAQQTGQVAGVISVGSRLAGWMPTDDVDFVHWGTAGSWDFNYNQMKTMDELLERQGVPHRLEIFDGPHRWFEPELASEAVAWMELQAMRRGLRATDPLLVEALWQEDVAAAEELSAGGDVLAAQRRWASIATTFDGLRDVTVAEENAAQLAQDRRWRRALKEERRWDAADERYIRDRLPVLGAVRQRQGTVSAQQLKKKLDIERLKRQAASEGYASIAARRMLVRVYTHASTYLTRELMAAARWRDAEAVLELAVGIYEDSPGVWYNLACAAAQAGHLDRSLEALQTAVEKGYTDLEHLDTDTNLEPLRGSEDHALAWSRLRGAGH